MTPSDQRKPPPFPIPWNPRKPAPLHVGAIALGLFYGVAFRLMVAIPALAGSDNGVLSLSFLILGPLAIGFLTIFPIERVMRIKPIHWIVQPWVPVCLTLIATAVLAIEGWICILMALPIALLLSSLGGLLGAAVARAKPLKTGTMVCLACVPVLLVPVEALVQPPSTIRTVENTIVIHAPASVVWQNIQSVPPIAPSELRPTWTHTIGFPRPIAAELSHPGIGGVRTATFERGLTFYETITDWRPQRQLSFSIKADTAHIPPTTLDQHVTVGGPYFDVLDGSYRIESLDGGAVRLHLTSHQRLTTDINNYASLWTQAIMSDLQTSILQVIQRRCERSVSPYTSSNQ